ncbi:MAG: magnesium transporter [Planctomycetales bacterium]
MGAAVYHQLLLPDLKQMLAEDDKAGLAEFCNALYPPVAAEVLEGLPAEDVWRVLENCSLSRQVEIFEFLSLAEQVELVDKLDRKRLSRLVEEMSPDDRVDLLSRLGPERVENLLPLIAQAERSDIRKLLSFPEQSAGAIMTTEYASLPADITVRDALDRLRKQAPDRETIYYIFILGEDRRLDGMISLRDLILAKPDAKLADLMRRDVISVRVDDDQEHVAQELARYDFLAIPVVDSQNRLVGIVTHDDVLDIVQEEADEDAYRLGAVEPLEDSYLETPLLTIVWKRGMWLVLLLFAALGTSAVLSRYEEVSQKNAWLIWFVPLVIACGGNAGSQSATLLIRALALRESVGSLRVVGRELAAGFSLGLFLGGLGFLLALLYVPRGHAMIIGTTVMLVVVMGAVTGAMLPILFKRLGMDPALMSNPLIASLSDILGLLIYYNVAVLVLRLLAA